MQYLEIVTPDADAVVATYARMLGVEFTQPDADLGGARVAVREDGSLIGVRMPLAAHESPIARSYLAVENIARAVEEARTAGATLAYGPQKQGARGTFAILIHGGVQHGLWQR